MAVIHEVAAKLQALGLGTVGTDIFPGSMPASPDECCAVFAAPGFPSEFGFGTPGVHYEYPGIKVRFRGPRPGPGVTTAISGPALKAQQAHDGLATVEVATLSGGGTSGFYHYLRPQRPPYQFGKDTDLLMQWDVDFIAEKRPSV